MTQSTTAIEAVAGTDDPTRSTGAEDSPPDYPMSWPASGMPALVRPADCEPAIWMSHDARRL